MLHNLVRHLDFFLDLTWATHLFKVNFHLWNSKKSISYNSFTEALVTDVAKSFMSDIELFNKVVQQVPEQVNK